MLRTLLTLLLGVGAAGSLPTSPAPCEVHLVLAHQPQLLAASGVCHSLLDQPASYRYELVARRWGRNSSTSTQGGAFELGPHQEAQLSKTTVNVGPADHYLLRLRVYNAAGQLVAQDSVRQDP
ncbi:hypothetical protein GO988_06535 [Hymenobacter sp. HMF4947]|uniref:Curli assembly protein CsgC n=1 Tax=Hymenobacter ginkgonis TaxID=2682976 RepID=A0A7K1TC41_9BACT|nr:curli-like amyloid fiber formation chaperone CsgH [Hymenobacter ginkgonis]MVN75976.1 hypothetical protein [Hymenobacter ginkgonis]